MTHSRLTKIMDTLGWDDIALAMVLRLKSETQVRHWRTGRRAIPPAITEWLERVAAWHTVNPPPAAPGEK